MRASAAGFYADLSRLIDSIAVTDAAGERTGTAEGIAAAGGLIFDRVSAGGKVMFIGNGASAAIASHMAADFSKAGGLRALAFNDGALLTCLGNDYGYAAVFEVAMEIYADSADCLVAISSSGSSENILRGARAALARGCALVTCSGFAEDNPLRRMGSIDFWVPADSYGLVEVVHHSICHCILQSILDAGQVAG
jgi:D-sedoheptulose 7-phosphate isomerase